MRALHLDIFEQPFCLAFSDKMVSASHMFFMDLLSVVEGGK